MLELLLRGRIWIKLKARRFSVQASYICSIKQFVNQILYIPSHSSFEFQQKILKLIIYLLEICAHCVIMFSQELGFQIFHVSKNATLCSIKQLLR